MELKNALAVCLISLFASTLVVLIARTLDVQTESRLEPQLAKIVEQLEGIRQQARIVGAVPSGQPTAGQMAERSKGLMVYYFHSNTRCPTCREIEAAGLPRGPLGFRDRVGGWEDSVEGAELRRTRQCRTGKEVGDPGAHGHCRQDREWRTRRLEKLGSRLGAGGRPSWLCFVHAG